MWAQETSPRAGERLGLALAGLFLFMCGRWSVGDNAAAARAQPQMAAEVARQLYDPPAGHAEIAVPSVLRDARGEIHNQQIGAARFNVLVSRAGTLRSGDVHSSMQLDLIFTGKVRLTTREAGRDVVRDFGDGDLIKIPPNIPHLFEFIEETVMVEWWQGPFAAKYYEPYRKRVDEAMRTLQGKSAQPPRRLGIRQAIARRILQERIL
ncbi:hypothetical protein T492DRAFT_1017840 [Pavlovales sp. CCMP2436]|nr:hypothetical protein T492DRAFT_1017840 [Pavlovales sp. CCMP2436]|mmetsp:Transcript_35484/g.88526  ORF Transcript_35484/g.88526 Transcript_35484/m.88526 type:complete len:208 (-) Transcript_35484:78-701(-)